MDRSQPKPPQKPVRQSPQKPYRFDDWAAI